VKIIRSVLSVSAVLLLVVAMLPVNRVGAANFSVRKVELQSSQAGFTNQNIYHEFTFQTVSGTAIGSIELEYCNTPLGTCVGPTGLDFTTNGRTLGTTTTDQAYGATSTPSTAFTNTFSVDTTGGDTTANRLRLEASATNAVAATEYVKIRIGGIENPTVSTFGDTSPANSQPDNVFFVRIKTYGTTSYGTLIDDGVVASAIEPLITVSARVQEILHFCVANTSVNDAATTNPGADCSAITGTVYLCSEQTLLMVQ
jgi:hypothetical protein